MNRLLIAIAIIGVLVTGYMTYTHTTGQTAYCPLNINGCEAIAQSHYSVFMGLPVALYGFLVWLTLLYLGITHHRTKQQTHLHWFIALTGGGVLAAGYFNGVMLKLGAFCIWCETAHLGMIVAFLISAYLVFGAVSRWTIGTGMMLFIIPFVFASYQTSSLAVTNLAQCLTQNDTSMYGAYWCPHCNEQKDLFGSAFDDVQYVECAEISNPRQQTPLCKAANIEGYPTWIRKDGQRLTGTKSLAQLAEWSGCPTP